MRDTSLESRHPQHSNGARGTVIYLYTKTTTGNPTAIFQIITAELPIITPTHMTLKLLKHHWHTEGTSPKMMHHTVLHTLHSARDSQPNNTPIPGTTVVTCSLWPITGSPARVFTTTGPLMTKTLAKPITQPVAVEQSTGINWFLFSPWWCHL